MKVELLSPTAEHIAELSAGLLAADRAEVAAWGGALPWAIEHAVEASTECYAITADGRLGTIVGVVAPDLASDARPWMLSTDLILAQPKICLKLSRSIYSNWLDQYGYMTNFVDSRHERAIRWLRWLGARFSNPAPFGPYSRPFLKFEFGEL